MTMHKLISIAIFAVSWSTGWAHPRRSLASKAIARALFPNTTLASSNNTSTFVSGNSFPTVTLTSSNSTSSLVSQTSSNTTITSSDSSNSSTSSVVSDTASSTSTPPQFTGNPLQYPDDHNGDCNPNLYSPDYDGPARWTLANANTTLQCFTQLYENDPAFDTADDFSTALARFMGAGNQEFSCGIGTGYSSSTCQDDTGCKDLMPYSLLAASNGSNSSDGMFADYAYPCEPENPNFHHRATGWVVIQSMVNYWTYLNTIYQQVQQAYKNANHDMGQQGRFFEAFGAPTPSDQSGTETGLDVLTMICGIFSGGIAAFTEDIASDVIKDAMPDIISTVTSGAIAAGTSNLTSAQSVDDMYGWWSILKQAIDASYSQYTNQIFLDGYVTVKAGNGHGEYNITLLDQLQGGLWAKSASHANATNATAINLMEQAIYAQMAQAVWMQSSQMYPFITAWDGDCTDESKLPHGFKERMQGLEQAGSTPDWHIQDHSLSVNGTCYSLLGSQPGTCIGTPPSKRDGLPIHGTGPVLGPGSTPGGGRPGKNSYDCCQWMSLPGGSKSVMTGNATDWAGLTLEDLISSAIAGWNRNNQRNGYNVTDMPTDFSQPGLNVMAQPGVVSNIPICDYRRNISAPGLNCPNIYAPAHSCSF